MSTTVLKRKPITSSSTSLIRLERSHSTLIQLREKLTSYWLEPTTFSMHEAKETFLFKIDKLTKTHLELTRVLGNCQPSTETQITAVERQLAVVTQLTNVKHLEEDIKEYIFSKVSAK